MSRRSREKSKVRGPRLDNFPSRSLRRIDVSFPVENRGKDPEDMDCWELWAEFGGSHDVELVNEFEETRWW